MDLIECGLDSRGQLWAFVKMRMNSSRATSCANSQQKCYVSEVLFAAIIGRKCGYQQFRSHTYTHTDIRIYVHIIEVPSSRTIMRMVAR
jgi:hypothetical protein